ncbi:CLUMA_CG005553, isoform A [Clunio marinus]|uniref:CLUMA_CG005553, isoform A n=1 Tax=Clunio marinus TaxID=568069 RepID=A0A1J1HV28_9DIPT|nr:CLUMA_CG005553, isoform A [Clunio marinus]
MRLTFNRYAIEFTKTAQNKDCLIFNGYKYHRNSTWGMKTAWACAKRKTENCKARIIQDLCTDDDGRDRNMVVEFTMNQKNCISLLVDGHRFYRRHCVGQKVTWACAQRVHFKCSVRVIQDLETNEVYAASNCMHTHEMIRDRKIYKRNSRKNR